MNDCPCEQQDPGACAKQFGVFTSCPCVCHHPGGKFRSHAEEIEALRKAFPLLSGRLRFPESTRPNRLAKGATKGTLFPPNSAPRAEGTP